MNALSVGDPPTALLVRLLVQGMQAGAKDLFAETILLEVAQQLLDIERGSGWEPTRDRPSVLNLEARLRRAVEFMSEDLSAQLSLEAIAREAGISKFHFTRLFSATLGCPPNAFMTQLRMDTARRMLVTTDQSVTAVAAMVGYALPRNFATAFRRKFGQTPESVRRSSRGY